MAAIRKHGQERSAKSKCPRFQGNLTSSAACGLRLSFIWDIIAATTSTAGLVAVLPLYAAGPHSGALTWRAADAIDIDDIAPAAPAATGASRLASSRSSATPKDFVRNGWMTRREMPEAAPVTPVMGELADALEREAADRTEVRTVLDALQS